MVCPIIYMNQVSHHQKKTFIEEYNDFLTMFDIDFDERYVFKPVEYDLNI